MAQGIISLCIEAKMWSVMENYLVLQVSCHKITNTLPFQGVCNVLFFFHLDFIVTLKVTLNNVNSQSIMAVSGAQ